MKTQFYQSTKRVPKQATILDLAKGFGYLLAVFIVTVGGVYVLGLLGGMCEYLSNFLK